MSEMVCDKVVCERWCVTKVSGADGAGSRIQNQKQEPHTNMWGKRFKTKKHAIICHKSGAKGCMYFPNHASWAKFFTLDLSGAALQHRQIAPMFSNKCFYILK